MGTPKSVKFAACVPSSVPEKRPVVDVVEPPHHVRHQLRHVLHPPPEVRVQRLVHGDQHLARQRPPGLRGRREPGVRRRRRGPLGPPP